MLLFSFKIGNESGAATRPGAAVAEPHPSRFQPKWIIWNDLNSNSNWSISSNSYQNAARKWVSATSTSPWIGFGNHKRGPRLPNPSPASHRLEPDGNNSMSHLGLPNPISADSIERIVWFSHLRRLSLQLLVFYLLLRVLLPPPPLFVQLSRIDFIFTWNKYDYRRNYFSGKIRAGASRRWDSFHIFLISSGGLKYSTLSLISKQKTHTNQLIKIMEEVCWYWPGVVGKWQWGQPMKSMVTSQIRTDNWIEPTAVWNEPHSQSMNKNPERNMLRGCDNNTHTHTC